MANLEVGQIGSIQKQLGLSDGKMALALGVTRQTWRNWRCGRTCPLFARNALLWMMELRKLSPDNDNLPERIKATTAIVGLWLAMLIGLDFGVPV